MNSTPVAQTVARPASRLLRGVIARFAGNDSRFALTRWFAAVGALAIGLFSVVMGWLLSSFLETRLLERDASISREFMQSIADIQNVVGFFREPHTLPAPSIVEFFAHVAAMPDVIRANVYAQDRRVLWSSQSALIGHTFPANDELDQALRGHVVVNHETEGHEDGKAEHQGLATPSRQFVESYLPVFDKRSHDLIGVIELYRQPVALFAAIESGQRLVWLSSAGGGVFLFVSLLWFVRRTEADLQEQQRRLVDAETLAIVGEISAAVAHSIRNPLVSIRTSAELQCEITGDQGGVNREIMRNVDRIEQLVRTLLSYAADPSDRQASADISAELRSTAQRFVPDLRASGKQFLLDVASDLGTADADPVVLAQVFDSLMANAIEATRAGDLVRVHARRDGDSARIDFSDNGSGIEADQMQNIFKPFYTTKPRGLGLGLPLARRLMKRLGGSLDIDSQPGSGTRVRLRFPVRLGTP